MFPLAAAAVAIWFAWRVLAETRAAELRNDAVRGELQREAAAVRVFLDELGAQDRPPPGPAPRPPWRPTIARPYVTG